MHLTIESEYALRGLAFLATCPPGAVVALADIAEAHDLPSTFLAKIFQKLHRHGLIAAPRGRGRGYQLARSPASITIRQILEIVEGARLQQRCLMWHGDCRDENPCPLHHRLKHLVPEIEWILDRVTLAEYVDELGDLARHAPVFPGSVSSL